MKYTVPVFITLRRSDLSEHMDPVMVDHKQVPKTVFSRIATQLLDQDTITFNKATWKVESHELECEIPDLEGYMLNHLIVTISKLDDSRKDVRVTAAGQPGRNYKDQIVK